MTNQDSYPKEVLREYMDSDHYFEDCLAVVCSSPLRSALFDATEKFSSKLSQDYVAASFEMTIGAAAPIVQHIVEHAYIIFDEWDDRDGADPRPDTVFEAYCDSEAIWDAYELLMANSPLNALRSSVLGWLGMTFPTTRLGEWATLRQADHYLAVLDALIKSIIEHANEAHEHCFMYYH